MNIREFPAEYFIELKGEDYLVGRLMINKMNANYWVEVDIVQKESRKIWSHVGDIHNNTDLDEAVHQSVQLLSDFLKKFKNS